MLYPTLMGPSNFAFEDLEESYRGFLFIAQTETRVKFGFGSSAYDCCWMALVNEFCYLP